MSNVAADSFAITISQWHDFYMLIGTGAATLLGLLFIALSLRNDLESSRSLKEERGIWSLGSISLLSLADVLLIALTFMLPNATPPLVVWPISSVGALFAILTIRSLVRVVGAGQQRTRIVASLAPLCLAGQTAAGVLLSRQGLVWLPALAGLLVILLLVALLSSWLLLVAPLVTKVIQRTSAKDD